MATAQVIVPRGPLGQPDIGYAPDYEKYVARVHKRTNSEKLDDSLPPGFPQKLESDLVWEGQDITGKYDWTYELNEEELAEIEKALAPLLAVSALEIVRPSFYKPHVIGPPHPPSMSVHRMCTSCTNRATAGA